jgi:UDP-N-acetylmuramoyl-tripeptide--D-alanyl-D-alanine ligase
MVHNALAAAASGLVDGLALADVAAALSEQQIPARLVARPGPGGSTLIDDTYNASPASMAAALDLLAEVRGRRIAVLGDMRELGDAEAEGHAEVGRRAAESADLILAVGELGKLIGESAREAGHRAVRMVPDKTGVASLLAPELGEGDVVLFKGSRALELETVIDELGEGL